MRTWPFVAIAIGVGGALACSTFTTDGGGTSPDGGTIADATIGADGGTDAVVVLASGLTTIAFVTADETYVYWGNDMAGTIERTKLDGTGVPSELETGLGSPSRIRVNAGTITWGDQNANKKGLYTDDIKGGGPGIPIYTGTVNTFDRRVDKTYAIITADDGFIHLVPPDGGAPSTTIAYATPVDVITDGNDFLWTASGAGTVWRMATGITSPVAANENSCEHLARNQDGVYWTRPADNLVRRKPASGGIAETIGPNELGAYGLAADDSGVYWLTVDGNVRRWTASGGKVETLASGQPIQDAENGNRRIRMNNMALTNEYVVWTTRTDIRRIAK